MSISRIESLPIVLWLIAGGLGVTAAPAAAQPQPVQRVTLPGMWADVRMQTTVTAGDSILIWVDLEPHDPGVRLHERRVALDLTPLGRQRTAELFDSPGDGFQTLEYFNRVSVYAPPGDVMLRFAAADLGRGGTFELPLRILRADGLPPLVIGRALPPRSRVEGHTSVGASEPATRWSAASHYLFGSGGATGYLLIANPGDTIATVRVSRPATYGVIPEQMVNVPARSRITLDLALGFTPDAYGAAPVLVESLGQSPLPIVAERSVYANRLDAIWALGSNSMLTPAS